MMFKSVCSKIKIHKEGLLFAVIVIWQAASYGYLIFQNRIVMGHDGFQYFALQYYFLNNTIFTKEIPQWMPFMTQGTVATWWYGIQASLLQNSLLFLSLSFLKGVNFLAIYYAGMFVDEMVLLTGTWLLARRFLSSPFSIFFVAVSVMGSCVWMTQPWFNFHFYYALPLILHFIHAFLETGKWRYFLGAGNLLAIQCLGNLPYFLPVTALVIFIYFLFYSVFNFSGVTKALKNLRFGWRGAGSLVVVVFSLYLIFVSLRVGVDQIINYNYGRSANALTNIKGYLSYGGNLDFLNLVELITGISPAFDYTLYFGFLGAVFIFLGFSSLYRRKNLHVLLTAGIILLLSAGTFIAVLFYTVWPLMKYYRHLALISPLVKFFLCLCAGLGFEYCFFEQAGRTRSSLAKRILTVILVISMCQLSFIFFETAKSSQAIEKFSQFIKNTIVTGYFMMSADGKTEFYRPGVSPLEHIYHTNFIKYATQRTALVIFFSAIFLWVTAFSRKVKPANFFIGLVLTVHFLDLCSYKFIESRILTVPLTRSTLAVMDFQPMPYADRRSLNAQQKNMREKILESLPIYCGQLSWSFSSFFFRDEADGSYRTDHWLLGLDRLMRVYWGQKLDDFTSRPAGLRPYIKLEFPTGHPAVLKVAGVTEDKIQFFSGAFFYDDTEHMAADLASQRYTGDTLLLFSGPKETRQNNENSLSENQRLFFPYRVERFDANHLEVTVDTKQADGIWMMYSDVWHPFWHVTINDKPQDIFIADLAYKAVRLSPGVNHVSFVFQSKLFSSIQGIFGLTSILWLALIGFLAFNILFRPAKT